MKALLLCAGRGSRLHPYTRNDSKVCLPFLNIPIAAYPLKLLEDIGVSHLLVNTHHQAPQVVETIDFLLTSASSVMPASSSVTPAKAGVQPDKHKAVHTGLKTADMRFAAERTFSRSASKPNLFSALPAQLCASTSSFTPASSVIPAKAGGQSIPHWFFVYEPHLLEGLGTLRKNKHFFKGEEDIIYLNGDSVFLCDDFFPQMLAQHKEKKALMTFLCSPFQKGASHLWVDKKGRVVPEGNSRSHQPCFFAGFVLVNKGCFSLFKKSDNYLFRDFVKRHHQNCFIYMQKDLKFFELGSLSSYMKSLHLCVKFLENPLSKEAKFLNKILKRYLSAEFMQDDSRFNLNFLRRHFFTGLFFQKERS